MFADLICHHPQLQPVPLSMSSATSLLRSRRDQADGIVSEGHSVRLEQGREGCEVQDSVAELREDIQELVTVPQMC